MGEDTAELTLVNINQIKPRTVVVQAGAYGENRFLTVKAGSGIVDVNARWFTVRLAPGAGIDLSINDERHTEVPTMGFPWHGDVRPAAWSE